MGWLEKEIREVRFYEVNSNFSLISRFTFTEPRGGTIKSLDFSPGGDYLYYISRESSKTYIYRKDLVSSMEKL